MHDVVSRRRRPGRSRWRPRRSPPRGHDVVVLEEHDEHRRSRALHRPPRHRGVRRARPSAPHHPQHHARGAVRRAPTAARSSSTPTASARPSSIARCSIRRSPTRAAPPAPSCAAARACARSPSPTTASRVAGDGARPARSTARACILACGASYRFNRAARPRRAARVRPERAARATVRRARSRRGASRPRRWRRAASRGSCRSRAASRRFKRVGLMCRRARRRRASATFAARCARASASTATPWPEPRLKILPLGPVAKTYGPALLAVGDAAGLVKPTTGGGIYYSLISGQIAADVLDPALRDDDLRESRLRAVRDALARAARRRDPHRPRLPRARLPPQRPRASTRSSSSRASTASSRCCSRPPTSTGIASPRSRSSATPQFRRRSCSASALELTPRSETRPASKTSDRSPRASPARGDYARKQIYCPSRVVAWSHGSRFDLARAAGRRRPRAARLLDYGCGDGTFVALTHGTLRRRASGPTSSPTQLAECRRAPRRPAGRALRR